MNYNKQERTARHDYRQASERNERRGQIAVHKTDKKLLEFIDGLNPAPSQDYAAIHAGAVRPYEKDGQRVHSVIRIVAQDYSRRGELSTRVKANISPEEAMYFAQMVKNGAESFMFHAAKIFGSPDKQGFCPVTKLWVSRCSNAVDTHTLSHPWKVTIENGRGKKEHGKNGGAFCKEGSYLRDKEVFLSFTDFEFFKLLCAVERFINLWEITNGTELIQEGRLARDTQPTTGSN